AWKISKALSDFLYILKFTTYERISIDIEVWRIRSRRV
ncbi:unnamed protein product, partial [marine sediment metagenome]